MKSLITQLCWIRDFPAMADLSPARADQAIPDGRQAICPVKINNELMKIFENYVDD